MAEPKRCIRICSGCEGSRPEMHWRPPMERILRAALTEHGLAETVAIRPESCLDLCQSGVAVAIEPEGTWFVLKRTKDVRALVRRHLLEGDPLPHLSVDPPL